MSNEGYIKIDVPDAGKECQTWYKVNGDLKAGGKRPLILLHGGPGVPSPYLAPIASILFEKYSVPTVIYDQVGCGKSTALSEKKDPSFWTVDLFVREFEAVISHLGIQDDYDLLGHSWGGMLAAEIATRQPKGLKRLIIASSPASISDWVKSAKSQLATLPEDVQKTVNECEENGDFESEAYQAATMVFLKQFCCRSDPWPDALNESFSQLEVDPTVYHTMLGPSEFTITGPLKNWDITDRISKIQVPTLVTHGEYDEATDWVVRPFFDGIDKVKWITFGDCSHCVHNEAPEKYCQVLSDFLAIKSA